MRACVGGSQNRDLIRLSKRSLRFACAVVGLGNRHRVDTAGQHGGRPRGYPSASGRC